VFQPSYSSTQPPSEVDPSRTPVLAALLEYLGHVNEPCGAGPGASGGSEWVEAVCRRVASALADPTISVLEYCVVARVIRLLAAVRSGSACTSVRVLWLRRTLSHVPVIRVEAVRFLERLEREQPDRPVLQFRRGCRCRAGRTLIMAHVGLDAGLTVPQLRRTIMVKRVTVELGSSDDHVRQIAFRAGYAFPSVCDRDFRRVLGLTPKQFRQLIWHPPVHLLLPRPIV
jgi:AraC-like DNA-binding protein